MRKYCCSISLGVTSQSSSICLLFLLFLCEVREIDEIDECLRSELSYYWVTLTYVCVCVCKSFDLMGTFGWSPLLIKLKMLLITELMFRVRFQYSIN